MSERVADFHVGIDLGTTNTVMATCKPGKRAFFRAPVKSINQYISAKHTGEESYLPSVLFIENDGVKVGKYAKLRKDEGAIAGILYNTKIDMGKKIEYENRFTPIKAAAEILKVCYKSILLFKPKEESFPNVTITVPASFTQSQIADTLEAARLAGFSKDKISILEEPVAALFSYINDQLISAEEEIVDFSSKKRVLVYDIGGGTCDVCVVDIEIGEDNIYSIDFIATSRYTEFGGNDFDEAIAINLLNKLFKRYNILDTDVNDPEIKNDLVARLLPYCEEYKKHYSNQLKNNERDQISNAVYGSIDNFLGNDNVELDVSFEEYEAYTRIFFEDNYTHPTRDLTDRMRDKNVIKPVYNVMEKIKKMGAKDIDCVFITGGMSKYRPIEDALREYCKVPVIKTDKPMEAVAEGAAISTYIQTNRNDTKGSVEVEMEQESATESEELDIGFNRPKLAESIYIDIENMLPLKIIDSEVSIPFKGTVDHVFKVSSSGVNFNLFAGASEYDPEMRILYKYAKKFDYLVKPNTNAIIRYEINENRFLQMFLDLQDERKQTYELTVDTTV